MVKAAVIRIDRNKLGRLWRAAFVLLVGTWLITLLLRTDFFPDNTAGLWLHPETWLFLAGWLLLPALLGALWRWNLVFSSGVRIPLGVALSIQGLAWGGRYLPGKAGIWLAKVSIAGRYGAGWQQLGHSVVVEQILFLLGGVLIGIVMMPWSAILGFVEWDHSWWSVIQSVSVSGMFPVAQAALVLSLIAAAFVSMILVARLLSVGFRWFEWPLWGALLGGHMLAHILVGLTLFPLVALIVPEAASILGINGVIAALALANVAGIAAVFAPAGLGVREVVLAGFLAVGAVYPEALAVAAFLRLVTFMADVVFAGGAWLMGGVLQSRIRRHV